MARGPDQRRARVWCERAALRLLVEARTYVFYRQEYGGHMCRQGQVEGFLVPVFGRARLREELGGRLGEVCRDPETGRRPCGSCGVVLAADGRVHCVAGGAPVRQCRGDAAASASLVACWAAWNCSACGRP
ncbi:DUF6210 family protein [Streptomyces sp. PKU-EA00015]|uniref:DUF6210 family protein n=1 Tax=Streptomyces sp. PKU-EA00015 TaxID=2748326 RepID=UPI0035C835A8